MAAIPNAKLTLTQLECTRLSLKRISLLFLIKIFAAVTLVQSLQIEERCIRVFGSIDS